MGKTTLPSAAEPTPEGIDSTDGQPEARTPRFTRRADSWSVRYALAAYVGTIVVANVVIAALYFGAGVPITLPVGGLIIDATLIATVIPLWRWHGLSPAASGA